MHWWKHAFAIEKPGPAEPTDAQRAPVERICSEVVRRNLTTPALIFLEMARPLNFLGAQTLHFFEPLLSVLSASEARRQFTAFLECRGSIDYLARRIEELESAAKDQETSKTESH
jgi:hypothetical protein